MFPNTALNSISPDVRMMQAFPNIFLLKEIVGHPTGCATRCKQANNRETSCERMFCHLLMRDLSFRFMLVAATPRCASRGIIRSKMSVTPCSVQQKWTYELHFVQPPSNFHM